MRHSLRQIALHPGFSVIAVLTLALAAGLNGWGFTFLNATMFQPSPIPQPDRVVALDRTKPSSAASPWSPADFDDARRSKALLATVAAYSFSGANFSAPGVPAQHITSMKVSAEFFGVFGVPPLLGRTIERNDDRSGAPPVAVASEGFWRRQLGADPGVIGRTIRLDGKAVTIIGVMPQRFQHPFNWGPINLWMPFAYDSWSERSSSWLYAVGRLKPGDTLAQAQSRANAFAARLEHDHPREDTATGIHLTPWELLRRGGALNRNVCLFASAMALAVLFVACANLAGLQLARAAGRTREFGVRLALGASRTHLVCQLLCENLLLSVAGGGLGLLFAQWGMRWTAAQISTDVFDGTIFAFDATAAAYVFVLALLAGAAFGLAPALLAARTDIQATLKQGGRGATDGRARHRLRNLLIVAEFALSLALLACAFYFTGGIRHYVDADWGWQPKDLLVGSVALPESPAYTSDADRRQFVRRLEDSLKAIPEVQAVGLSGWQPVNRVWLSHRFAIEGTAPAAAGREPVATENPVSPNYFSAFGTRLIAGRAFNDFDQAGSAPVVIINEALARKISPDGNALHRRIRYLDGAETEWAEVVGIVNGVQSGLDVFVPPETALQSYRPMAQVPTVFLRNPSLAVRLSSPNADVGASIRRAVAKIDPDLPIVGLESATDGLRLIVAGIAMLGQTLSGMALFGVLLASIGIYGVIANLVARRTPEIGIRMALGASPRQVLTLVLGNGVRLATGGAVVGLLISLGLYRLLAAIMPRISATGVPLLLVITLALFLVAVFACWLPAQRATKVDPVVALRAE